MLPVALPLVMGGVAVLQPFGPGRETVCTGQPWSDSTAGDVVHLFSFHMGPSLPALGVRNMAVVLLLLSSHQLGIETFL